jgi:cytochrome P450
MVIAQSTIGLPPGPRLPKPIQTLQLFARQRPQMERLRRRYGPMFTIRPIGFPAIVIVSDTALVRQVFTEDPEVLVVGDDQNPLMPILGRNSLLVLDGRRHLAQRKLLLPPFHGKRMQGYEALIERIAEEEIAGWPTDRPFATADSFRRITLRAILQAVFGVRGSQADELERLLPPLVNLGSLMAVAGRTLQRDLGPLSPWGRFVRGRREFDARIGELIAQAREEPEERDDVLAMMVQARHEDGSPMADDEIADQLLTLLTAGHETTATTLAWAIERLRRHPEVCERLAGGDREWRDATIREVQRQRPVVHFAARSTTQPYELGGYTLPADVRIGLAAVLTHFDPDLFPEPDRFLPERFVGVKPDTYSWIPFGGGVRRCIGAAFAHMEMEVVLRTLLRMRTIDARPDLPAVEARHRGVTHVPADGGEAVFRSRLA